MSAMSMTRATLVLVLPFCAALPTLAQETASAPPASREAARSLEMLRQSLDHAVARVSRPASSV